MRSFAKRAWFLLKMYHPLFVRPLISGASGDTDGGTTSNIISGIITDVVIIVNYNAFDTHSQHARSAPEREMATPFNYVCPGLPFSNLMNLAVLRFLGGHIPMVDISDWNKLPRCIFLGGEPHPLAFAHGEKFRCLALFQGHMFHNILLF